MPILSSFTEEIWYSILLMASRGCVSVSHWDGWYWFLAYIADVISLLKCKWVSLKKQMSVTWWIPTLYRIQQSYCCAINENKLIDNYNCIWLKIKVLMYLNLRFSKISYITLLSCLCGVEWSTQLMHMHDLYPSTQQNISFWSGNTKPLVASK